MEFTNEDISKIVNEVINRINNESVKGLCAPENSGFISDTVEEAVIKANDAFIKYQNIPVQTRINIIENIRKRTLENIETLSRETVSETKIGNVEDKIIKNLLAINKTPGLEDLITTAFSGDYGLSTVELAPLGVLGSITPVTNPTSTIINNSISMLSAGNTVVFNPHPSSKNVSIKTIQIINNAITEAGGPENLVNTVLEPTLKTSEELMKSRGIRTLVVTGGPVVVKAALNSGKRAICAGPGNPPCLVDETADIEKAGKDIVTGASFDNNLVCILEKEVFVVKQVADDLLRSMRTNGAYILSDAEFEKITGIIFTDINPVYPVINKEFVGKSPHIIARSAGINIPPEIKLLAGETHKDHPLVMTEQLMPVLHVVRVNDVNEGISLSLAAEKKCFHTSIMHSTSIKNLHQFAKRANTSIFVKNGPSLSGLGFNGEGYTSLTIAGATGEGITTARTFTRPRRCVLAGYFKIT